MENNLYKSLMESYGDKENTLDHDAGYLFDIKRCKECLRDLKSILVYDSDQYTANIQNLDKGQGCHITIDYYMLVALCKMYEERIKELENTNINESEEQKVDLDEIERVYRETYKEYVDSHEDMPDYWKFEKYPVDNCIIIDIPWGDWKHDHMRCDDVMELVAKKLKLKYSGGEEEAYEENGSDTYSATHVFDFDNDNDDFKIIFR